MRRFKQDQKYKVAKAKLPTDIGRFVDAWLITEDLVPDFVINQWIDNKSTRKITTGKEYGDKLVVFLNFLDNKNKTYVNAKVKDIETFFKFLAYGDSLDIVTKDIDDLFSFSTLSKYITVIKEFYKYYDRVYAAENNGQYKDIWNYDYESIIGTYTSSLHGKQEYIKWYTEEEKEALLSNFKTLRDKAIFLITLEGFRIDEVLSMRLKDYNSLEKVIKPSRSKGKHDGIDENNKLRKITLPTETCKIIDSYLYTERADAEYESGKLNEMIFINLNKGSYQGNPLLYRNYWEIIKKCATRAKMNSEKIRTHSGRSTKVMEMLEHQAEYPEDGISDASFLEQFGWSRIDSMQPYKNNNNDVMGKKLAEKMYKRKFKKREY